jgi:tetratricopeptide (TPR) repeat protein
MICGSIGRVFGLLCSVTIVATAVARADEASNDRVIAEKTEIIATDATNAVAYELRGEAYYIKHDWNRAFEDCSAAIRIDPNFGRAYNCRGRAYSAKGDRDHAMIDYNEAIRLDPNYGPAYTSRAEEYFNMGDFDRAIAGFTEAIERSPKQAYRALVMRGEVYAAKGDTDHAVADYSEAMQRNPAAAWPYELRSTIRLHRGEINAALDDCDGAVRLEPGRAGGHYCRAMVFLKKDDPTALSGSWMTLLGLRRLSRRPISFAASSCTGRATTNAPLPISTN